MRAIDCQGLAGAFTFGTAQAGWEVVAKLELPGAFGIDNVKRNAHLINDKLEFQDGPWEEWELWPDIDYVFGNPPCSGFSLINTAATQAKKRGTETRNHRGWDSPINDCMWAMAEYVGRFAPKYVAMESVQQAYSKGRNLMQMLRDKVEEKTQISYRLTHVKVSGSSLGNPQMRHRYYMVLSRHDVAPFMATVPGECDPYTYFDAFSDLQGLEITWDGQPYKPEYFIGNAYQQTMRRSDGHVSEHITRSLEDDSLAVCRQVGSLVEEWEQGDGLQVALKKHYEKYGSMPDVFDEEKILSRDWKMGFQQPRRIRWTQKGYVVTGSGGFDFVHPEESRFLTIREVARLQGFPDEWRFDTVSRPQHAFAWIGKGVPSQCGRWISEHVGAALRGRQDDSFKQGEEIGEDEYLIDVTYAWKGRHNLEEGEA